MRRAIGKCAKGAFWTVLIMWNHVSIVHLDVAVDAVEKVNDCIDEAEKAYSRCCHK
jgi:hypothetical protein